jgi:BirA family biotin operon repressor/biotin-[acetyl-CoA-carboxylase] ligase
LGNRKLGGILTELVVDAEQRLSLVLGIGINVLQESHDFSPEVAKLATSLALELGRPVDREQLGAVLLEELDCMYSALKAGELTAYLAAYRKDCVNLGRRIQVLRGNAAEPAVAIDVDEEFGLRIRLEDGRKEIVRSGEVSVRGLYGYVD